MLVLLRRASTKASPASKHSIEILPRSSLKSSPPAAPASAAGEPLFSHIPTPAQRVLLPTSSTAQVLTVTSGKGGVGKTTSAASIALGLAQRGARVILMDFDIGLRNCDIHLGMERRVIYDFVNVLRNECTLRQALIPDKREPRLQLLAASQTKDKSALELEAVGELLERMKAAGDVDVIIADSPAGIESGAHHAMYFADTAVICTNPELSSLRDADKMVGLLLSKSAGALAGSPPDMKLLITRYNATRAEEGDALSVTDITEMLGLPLLGVVPDNSKAVLRSTNVGKPAILADKEEVSGAYQDAVDRLLGEEKPLRFTEPVPKSLFARIFGGSRDD